MARHMDVEERRQRVAQAACRVLLRDGIAALSVRNVAVEAELPPSSLRYTFPTQASVRDAAMALVADRLVARVAAIEEMAEVSSRARLILLELVPLDAVRRQEMEVFLAFGVAAMTDHALQDAHRKAHAGFRDVCARAFRLLRPEASGETEIIETDRLHALIDGLALHIVRNAEDANPDWAVLALDLHLQQLVAGQKDDRR